MRILAVISNVRSIHVINAKTFPPGIKPFFFFLIQELKLFWSDDPWLGISDRGTFNQFPTNFIPYIP